MGKKIIENNALNEQEKQEIMPTPSVTPIDLKAQKKSYNNLIGLIKREYTKVEKSSLSIAFALHHIYKEELFRIDGFNNISECGEEHFNLGKSTVNAFINVVEKFGKKDDKGNVLYDEQQGIREDMEKFTWSKLCLLVSVPDIFLHEFDSSMTAKEIREKKAEIAKLISADENGDVIDTPEDEPTTDKSEHDVSDTSDTEEQEQDNGEEMAKRCIVPLYSCTTMTEFKALLENEELLLAMGLHVDKLSKDIAKDKVPHIEVMFTYID